MPEYEPTKRRILIVDDHPGITHVLRVVLEKTGRYVVREVNRSSEAVAIARGFQPDLMLLDMDMPKLDGSQVAARVRADESLGDTAIVFLTSLVTPREVAAGKRIEGCVCLSKPTGVEELVQVIEESLAAATVA